MPRVKVNELLKHATENRYGVAAVNTLNVETVKYVIAAAERERVPVIVQFYPGFENYTALKHLAFAACDHGGAGLGSGGGASGSLQFL